MNSELEKEYNFHFKKFYNDLFKFQTKSKKHSSCEGCSTKKRFIFNKDHIIYSCGPKQKNKKCGPQFTIYLPKYNDFYQLKTEYNSIINGPLEYLPNQIINYDLNNLSKKMNVTTELNQQTQNIQNANDSLKTLINDYIQINNLLEKKQNLKDLSEKRLKMSIEKKKIMKQLNTDISNEEKQILRKKYALLIHESKEFIPMIQKLKQHNNSYLMISKPKIINNLLDDIPDKIYNYEEQIQILINFYKKINSDKTETDIKKIIDNRRQKGTPKGTEIPHKPWLNLCEKLYKKYEINPLE